MGHAAVRAKHDIVSSLYVLAFGEAQRICLDDLLGQGLGDAGGGIGSGPTRGRRRSLCRGG